MNSLRWSAIFLFISSLFLLNLLSESQSGPDWEVSRSSSAVMEMSSFFASLFMILSTVTFLLKVKQYMSIGHGAKHLFIIWYIVVLAAFVVIVRHGGAIDAFRFSSTDMQENVSILYFLGIGTSFIFLIFLFIAFGKKYR